MKSRVDFSAAMRDVMHFAITLFCVAGAIMFISHVKTEQAARVMLDTLTETVIVVGESAEAVLDELDAGAINEYLEELRQGR